MAQSLETRTNLECDNTNFFGVLLDRPRCSATPGGKPQQTFRKEFKEPRSVTPDWLLRSGGILENQRSLVSGVQGLTAGWDKTRRREKEQ